MSANQHGFDRAFAALSDILNVGVLVLDATGKLAVANPSACHLLGHVRPEDLRAHWPTVGPLLQLEPLPQTATPLRRAVDFRGAAAARGLRMEIHALDAAAEAGWLVLLKDRQIVDARDASLLLASRMHTQVYLYGALSHDLKTPLNSMQITLELLAGTLADLGEAPPGESTAALQRYVKVLQDDVARLNRNLHTAVAQPLSAEVQTFDLGDIVRETSVRLESQMRRQGVALQLRLPDRAVTLRGAEDWFKQALLNIAVTLLEAMPGEGHLNFDCEAQAGLVSVVISNDGPRIAETTLDEIDRVTFTPGKSWAAMDLYLARVVVESLGGEFRVDTEGAQGTCFRLLFAPD